MVTIVLIYLKISDNTQNHHFFFNLGINIKDKHEVAKSHLKVQSIINKENY